MASRNKGTVPETEAERALAELARAKFADYTSRWLPLQRQMAADVMKLSKPGTFEQRGIETVFGAETGKAFTGAERAAEAAEWSAGINPGSARSRMRAAGMAADRAASSGIGFSKAQQIIDDAYVRGLSALMAAGRGKAASTSSAMADAARLSQQAAYEDAAASAANRATNYGIAGTAAGYGLRAFTSSPQTNRTATPGPENVFEWGYPEG